MPHRYFLAETLKEHFTRAELQRWWISEGILAREAFDSIPNDDTTTWFEQAVGALVRRGLPEQLWESFRRQRPSALSAP